MDKNLQTELKQPFSYFKFIIFVFSMATKWIKQHLTL